MSTNKGHGIKRTITHWTGGGWIPNEVDLKAYNRLTRGDGQIVAGNNTVEDNVVTSDGTYARHTLNLNAGSAGMAMCGMMDAKESPFDPGPYPIKESQFRAHCIMLAQFHIEYGIPVTPQTCLTHAEVQGTLGVPQRNKWDISRLAWRDDIRGANAVGDYMRALVLEAQGHPAMPHIETEKRTTLKRGMRGVRVEVEGLQKDLASLGYFSGAVDGLFGTHTEEAVQAFQSDNGLASDGVFGPMSWRALDSADPRPLRPITAKELTVRGSETMANVNVVKQAAGGLIGIEAVTTGMDIFSQAKDQIISVDGLLREHWPVLLIAIVCIGIYFSANRIGIARVRDHITGANKGR